jgi:hypothetical protein
MRSRIDELLPFAEENEGFVTAAQARSLGIKDSVLARLTQRGKLQRVARGVYRIPYFPSDRLGQYREAILWARADSGPFMAFLMRIRHAYKSQCRKVPASAAAVPSGWKFIVLICEHRISSIAKDFP